VSVHHGALKRLRADSKTDSFKKLYKSRAPGIEGIFGEAKENHGLRRAWRCGLSKMLIQSLLIASVLNFKRLIAVLGPLNALEYYFKQAMRVILTIVEQFWDNIFHVSQFKINIDLCKY